MTIILYTAIILIVRHKNNMIGTTNYGINFTSFVSKENIYGVQFHPEKSSKQGLKINKKFFKTMNAQNIQKKINIKR